MRHCVVTGGADGIGRALAEYYLRAGYLVSIIDRDAGRVAEFQHAAAARGALVHGVHADLARLTDIHAVFERLAALPPIDLFVHSAGINAVGPFARQDPAAQQRVLDVNLRAPLHLTAGLLRTKQIAQDGTLVFIASLSVFTGYPGAAVYAAGKDGLSAYARSLRVALEPRGINVLTVYPGPTRTAHARRYSPDNRREALRMPPERLASLIAEAVQDRRAILVPGIGNRLFALLGRCVTSLTEYLMRKTIFERLSDPPG